MSRNCLVEHFPANAAYQEAALVWEASDQILPKSLEVRNRVPLSRQLKRSGISEDY